MRARHVAVILAALVVAALVAAFRPRRPSRRAQTAAPKVKAVDVKAVCAGESGQHGDCKMAARNPAWAYDPKTGSCRQRMYACHRPPNWFGSQGECDAAAKACPRSAPMPAKDLASLCAGERAKSTTLKACSKTLVTKWHYDPTSGSCTQSRRPAGCPTYANEFSAKAACQAATKTCAKAAPPPPEDLASLCAGERWSVEMATGVGCSKASTAWGYDPAAAACKTVDYGCARPTNTFDTKAECAAATKACPLAAPGPEV
jgi:hypothetical protein